MYKWNIDIYLKGKNDPRCCRYYGPENNSGDVIVKLFQGKSPNEWVSLEGFHDGTVTYVVVGEIASIDICERK